MLFLIEYNREEGKTKTFKTFDNSDEAKAKKERLELELELNRKHINNEVVLLRASSEEVLRHTHARYFYSFEEMGRIFCETIEKYQIKAA
jgi:hypothetical protein